ncbi:MAG: YaiI/YqxD family protein [Geothrix sp.]|uniref:YaiI/YqxD family protein n=1 Tax=Geothrix sp. TaxID=1962974 RepID=UPI0017C7F406|nr:YaiI/YqxD family protein [Geothrix sp.]NWJ41603.1 YaiI/YqxD family protein [Geothrix sp.]WIL20415.1 MAG: YaiI/YqxD family protein [Geothrix sp.]
MTGGSEPPASRIFVDADACPVKDEIFRVAQRYALKVLVVSNSMLRLPRHPLIEAVVVAKGQFDGADDWIVEQITDRDIAVTADIPLAARCLEKGARALDAKGKVYSPDSIGDALASRELMAHLRAMGEMGGGPPPFTARDRSTFLQRLDDLIQALRRAKR